MTDRADASVRFQGAVRRYDPQHVIGPVDLMAAPGECAALVGPNGCGKSTMLRAAAGTEPLDDGTVHVLGERPVQASPDFRARVSALDETSFFPDLTVREHLELIAVGHGLGQDTDRCVEETLSLCRLSHHADMGPGKLSRGLQQLMSIAVMLLPRTTEVLLLDEPERHLDAEAKGWLVTILEQRKKEGACLLLATHHRPFVDALAGKVFAFDTHSRTGDRGTE